MIPDPFLDDDAPPTPVGCLGALVIFVLVWLGLGVVVLLLWQAVR